MSASKRATRNGPKSRRNPHGHKDLYFDVVVGSRKVSTIQNYAEACLVAVAQSIYEEMRTEILVHAATAEAARHWGGDEALARWQRYVERHRTVPHIFETIRVNATSNEVMR